MRIIAIAIVLSFGWSSAWAAGGAQPVYQSRGDLTLSQVDNATGTQYELDVEPGDEIKLIITDTCKGEVAIKYLGYTPPANLGTKAMAANTVTCSSEQKTVSWTHAAKHGGYVVTVTLIDPSKTVQVTQADGSTHSLEERTYILRVPQKEGWGLSFSGGFTLSKLIDRKYSVETRTLSSEGEEDVEVFIIQRNQSAEDNISPGAGFFAHISNPRFRIDAFDMDWALTFGIGVGQGEETTRMAGLSLGFGEFKVTVGQLFGTVGTLPNGYKEGDQVPAANAIDTLDTRTDHAWFFAFSYDFLGGDARGGFTGKLAPPTPK